MQRKTEDRNIRKIFENGDSYAVTLPVELVRELKWKNKQKVTVKKYGKGILITDWKWILIFICGNTRFCIPTGGMIDAILPHYL